MLGSNAKRKVERKAVTRDVRAEPTDDVATALRSVYEKAVEEDIPSDMLDLLGKLK